MKTVNNIAEKSIFNPSNSMNNYKGAKPMNTHTLLENLLISIFAATGGFIQFHLSVQTYPWAKIIEAGGMAMFCGAAGMFGKQLYIWIKQAIKYVRKQYFKS